MDNCSREEIMLSLFQIEKQAEINGIEMGVLENGMPFLSEMGLAKMCGIARSPLNRLAANWLEEKDKPRGKEIASLLGPEYDEPTLFLKSIYKGREVNAYPESVCMALLEYFAFVADPPKEQAIQAYRALARRSFREFVYTAVGYAPQRNILDGWRNFHDRVDMTNDAVPEGYFSVFREIASMIVPMIRSGVLISDKTVPDISVGVAWSKYWEKNNLDQLHGERQKYDHEYPDYYPQARSNPQSSYAYPDAALGEFRAWLRNEYITTKFPKYLITQARKQQLLSKVAQQAIDAFSPKGSEN